MMGVLFPHSLLRASQFVGTVDKSFFDKSLFWKTCWIICKLRLVHFHLTWMMFFHSFSTSVWETKCQFLYDSLKRPTGLPIETVSIQQFPETSKSQHACTRHHQTIFPLHVQGRKLVQWSTSNNSILEIPSCSTHLQRRIWGRCQQQQNTFHSTAWLIGIPTKSYF